MPSDPVKPAIYTNLFFCNSVLEDTDGLLTAIRISDIYYVPPMAIDEILPDGTTQRISKALHPPLQVSAILMFRSEAPVQFEASIVGITPSGKKLAINQGESIPVTISGGVEGYTMNIALTINSEHKGELWFEVYVDNKLATKAPFRILKQPPIRDPEASLQHGPELPENDRTQG